MSEKEYMEGLEERERELERLSFIKDSEGGNKCSAGAVFITEVDVSPFSSCFEEGDGISYELIIFNARDRPERSLLPQKIERGYIIKKHKTKDYESNSERCFFERDPIITVGDPLPQLKHLCQVSGVSEGDLTTDLEELVEQDRMESIKKYINGGYAVFTRVK